MIATLPMYLRPENAQAHNRYWQVIAKNLRSAGINAPNALSGGGEGLAQWLAPNLLLSQTCGRPYRLNLHGKVTLIGTPDYGLTDCPPGYYRSPFVVRSDDPRSSLPDFATSRFAYNDKVSQSGWAAPQCHAAKLGFHFENTHHTGSHQTAARAVAETRADIAALDAVTWLDMQRYDGFSSNLRVLDWTQPTPGLPYISAQNADQPAIFAALSAAIATLKRSDRDLLHLTGLVPIPAPDYLAVSNP